jgi:lysyl-tRNA synthetase class 2
MSEESLRDLRLAKLARMRELGLDPYAVEKFPRTASANELKKRALEVPDNEHSEPISFAGRILRLRSAGKAGFADLSDGEDKIQLYVKVDNLTPEEYECFSLLDIGDHVGVEGTLFRTRSGEPSINVTKLVPLSKALHFIPVPVEKDGKTWYGLTDVETRYRHRNLDLIANRDSRRKLVERAKIVSAVRRYFDDAGYLEVETHLLQTTAGGASATPFITHYNAYDLDVKLRISLELPLKRLIAGDLPKVYEIGRVFRNENVSDRHNPEFTLLEFYEAYVNLEDMMTRVEELCRYVALKVYGTTKVNLVLSDDVPEGEEPKTIEVDFAEPWRRVDLISEICALSGLSPEDLGSLEKAKEAILAKGILEKAEALGSKILLDQENDLGGLIEKLLEVFVEPTLIKPAFVIGYPIETSPLAKKDPNRPGFTRRFEGYVLGREMCNAFSEINDPIDQRQRFEDQAAQLAKGNKEAHPYDEEFVYALECGMPPTGGCGIGMERLAMIFTGASHIREILFFPTMRPRSNNDSIEEESN